MNFQEITDIGGKKKQTHNTTNHTCLKIKSTPQPATGSQKEEEEEEEEEEEGKAIEMNKGEVVEGDQR